MAFEEGPSGNRRGHGYVRIGGIEAAEYRLSRILCRTGISARPVSAGAILRGFHRPAGLDPGADPRLRGQRLLLRSALDPHAVPRDGRQHLRLRHHAGRLPHRYRPGRRPRRAPGQGPRAGRPRLRRYTSAHRRPVRRGLPVDGSANSRVPFDIVHGGHGGGGDAAGDDLHRRHLPAGGADPGTHRARSRRGHRQNLCMEHGRRDLRRGPGRLLSHPGTGLRGIHQARRMRQSRSRAVGGVVRQPAQLRLVRGGRGSNAVGDRCLAPEPPAGRDRQQRVRRDGRRFSGRAVFRGGSLIHRVSGRIRRNVRVADQRASRGFGRGSRRTAHPAFPGLADRHPRGRTPGSRERSGNRLRRWRSGRGGALLRRRNRRDRTGAGGDQRQPPALRKAGQRPAGGSPPQPDRQ